MDGVETTQRITNMARRQRGVVSRRQLIGSGVPPGKVDSRVRSRFLKCLYAGVYSIGHDVLTLEGRWTAGVLAGGPNAVLSHRSAAALLGLLPPVNVVEVIRSSSPDRHRPPPEHASRTIHPGLQIHRTRSLLAHEVTTKKGIRTTSAIRTLINLAEREPRRTLREAVRNGFALKLFSLGELSAAFESCRGRKGIKLLRDVISSWDPNELRVRSNLELTFLDFCKHHELPAPVVNDYSNDHEIDFQWDGTDLIVEVDGAKFHEDSLSRARDYRRDLELTATGKKVIRVDRSMLHEEGAKTAILIRRLLNERRGLDSPSSRPEKRRSDLQDPSPHPVAVSERAPP